MNRMKIGNWMIALILLTTGASLLVNDQSVHIEATADRIHYADNTNPSQPEENWVYWNDEFGEYLTHGELSGIGEAINGIYQMSRSGDAESFGVNVTLNDMQQDPDLYRYIVTFQLWGLHTISDEDGSIRLVLVKHGIAKESQFVSPQAPDSHSTVEFDVIMKSNDVQRPAGCYWLEYHAEESNNQGDFNSPEQYLSNLTDRVNFADGEDMHCPPLWGDNDSDGHDDASYNAGVNSVVPNDCPDSSPPYYWDGLNCVEINWEDINSDGHDDSSYDAGFSAGASSVDITVDNPNCVWETHHWNSVLDDQDGDGCVAIESYQDGFNDGLNSVKPSPCPDKATFYWDGKNCNDLPVSQTEIFCDWDNGSTWDGTQCIEPNQIEPCGEDDVNLTGNGDATDLTVVGGAALLAGIGISTLLGQTGRNPTRRPENEKKPDVDFDDIRDIVEDIDVDLDVDLDKERPRMEPAKPNITGGSDQYFKSGVERQKSMTDSADPLLDDYIEEESEG